MFFVQNLLYPTQKQWNCWIPLHSWDESTSKKLEAAKQPKLG